MVDTRLWRRSRSSSSGSGSWVPDGTFGLHGYLLNDGFKGYLSYASLSTPCLVDSKYVYMTYTKYYV